MSGQLESPHFFRVGDTVRSVDGQLGTVIDGATLYAIIDWPDGRREEVDQFDSRLTVITRAEQDID